MEKKTLSTTKVQKKSCRIAECPSTMKLLRIAVVIRNKASNSFLCSDSHMAAGFIYV